MSHLLKLFVGILLLRKGPQSLPDSRFLLGVVLLLHFVLGVVVSAFSYPFAQALGAALIGTTLVVALVQAALMVRELPLRFTRTAMAVAGAEFLISLVMLPFTAVSDTVASVAILLMLGWNFAVNAHIFRHALGTSTGLGIVTSLVYMLISFFVAGLLTGSGA